MGSSGTRFTTVTLTGNTLTNNAPIYAVGEIEFNAGNAVNINDGLTSTNGPIDINGVNAVTIGGAAILNAGTGNVTIDSADANVVINGVLTTTGGGLFVNADTGITVNNSLTSQTAATFNADVDGNGTGIFTVADGQTVTLTAGGTITAGDVVLNNTGAINAAGQSLTLNATSTNAIELGTDNGAAFALANVELNNIQAAAFEVTGGGTAVIDTAFVWPTV